MTLQQQAVNEIKSLSDDQLMSLIQFLKSFKIVSIPEGDDPETTTKYRKRGILKGKVNMSEDFNDTPEGFEEYM